MIVATERMIDEVLRGGCKQGGSIIYSFLSALDEPHRCLPFLLSGTKGGKHYKG